MYVCVYVRLPFDPFFISSCGLFVARLFPLGSHYVICAHVWCRLPVVYNRKKMYLLFYLMLESIFDVSLHVC